MKNLICSISFSLFFLTIFSWGRAEDRDVAVPQIQDKLQSVSLDHEELGGEIDRRIIDLIYKNYMVLDLENDWLNPFCHRADCPCLHWANVGEGWTFYGIGKLLEGGAFFSQYTHDPQVIERTRFIADQLRQSRDPSGYIGFWNVEPDNRQEYVNWILHEQEFLILAYVTCYRVTENPVYLEDACILGDYVMATFPKTDDAAPVPPNEIGTASLPESFLELYKVTGEEKYREFAGNVRHGSQWEINLGALRTWNQEFVPPRRHVYINVARVNAQLTLYHYEANPFLLKMTEYLKRELLRKEDGAMLVTGTMSHAEQFAHSQEGAGTVGESCVTAYLLRWCDHVMRFEGNLKYGDVMERSIYNALFAAQSPDGRRIRYYTPMTGDRLYFDRDSYCCPGNFRRIMGELPQKVYYRNESGAIVINLYTESQKAFDVAGTSVTIAQKTDYPNSGEVQIQIEPSEPVEFELWGRTPRWAEQMTVQVNEEEPLVLEPSKAENGAFVLKRLWKPGDIVKISIPMDWRLVRGRQAQIGKVALLRGPIVYCVGKDQNAAFFAASPNLDRLILDPASIGECVPDASIRPDGQKVTAKAWTSWDRTGPQVEIVLTEFVDPSGVAVYFNVPDLEQTAPLRIMDDEIFFDEF